MTRRISIADFLEPEEAAHLAVALRAYRRHASRNALALPASFAQLEVDLTGAVRSRQDATVSADLPDPVDDQFVPDTHTLPQAAQRLRCSRRTVERRIAAGEIPVVHVGRLVRIRTADLDAILERESA